MNRMNVLGGSVPQFNAAHRTLDQLPLYFSDPEDALLLDGTIMPGFGILKAGTVMAAYGEYLVPYTPTTIAIADPSRAFLTANASSSTLYVPNAQAVKFLVGQTVVASDTDATYTDGGAIVSIDVDFTPGITRIIVTNSITATVAKSANIYHKAGASGKFSTPICLIDESVDTGSATSIPTPVGALSSLLFSNAILYTSALIGMDAAAITALGSVSRGQYTILK